MKACYTVKSHLTRPQTLTAVKVSKQQPPQPCAFDTQLRARTVPGLFGKAGLDGKPLPFWEATMAWTRATPVLKRKLQQLPFSEFAQISKGQTHEIQSKIGWWHSIYSAWLTECHSGEKRADNNKLIIKGQTPEIQSQIGWWHSIYSAWLTECHSGEKRAGNNKFLTGFVKRWLQKLWKQANSAASQT